MPFLILLKNIILSIYSYSLCKAESPVTVAAPAVTTSLFTKMLYLLDINCKYEIHCWEYTQEDEEADSNPGFVRFWSESLSPSQEFSGLKQQIHIGSCNCICKQCAISGSDGECWNATTPSIYSSTKWFTQQLRSWRNASFSTSHGAANGGNSKFIKPRPAVLARLKAAN